MKYLFLCFDWGEGSDRVHDVDPQVLSLRSSDKCFSLPKGYSEPFAEECRATLTSSTCYFLPRLSPSLPDSLGGLEKVVKRKCFVGIDVLILMLG